MYPVRKLLTTKLSKSCAKCDKVLLKPGINPSQVQFDLRHVAWLFLPRFKISTQQGAVPASFKKNEESSILLSITHLVQEFMYFKLEPSKDSLGNAEILLPKSETFEYILPHQFDADVDIELQEQLTDLKSKQSDPAWIVERSESSVEVALPFIPRGDVGQPLKV